MQLSAIKAASAEHLRLAQMDAAEISETTPSQVTNQVEAFAEELGGTPLYVPVVADEQGLYGWCSDGVREKVKAEGGAIVFGWTIWEWPRVMLTAEFHAVWRNDAGEMFDITPKPGGEQRILFVP